MKLKRQKPRPSGSTPSGFGRSGFGNRHSGREFGRQIDADLTDVEEPTHDSDPLPGVNLADANLAGRTDFSGAEFPEIDLPHEAPPITHAIVRERAMRLLVIREHGRLELEQKLLQRELPPDLIVSVLDQLAQEGLQCDFRFAESYTRMRVDRGYGANKVRADLQTRRLEQSVIEEALIDNGADWSLVAGRALLKKFGGVAPPDLKTRAKMERFLYRRGFSVEEIKSAMNDIETSS